MKYLHGLMEHITKIYHSRQTFRHHLMQIINDLEASWMDGSAWQHAVSGNSVRCKVRTLYFPADATLFYRNGLWNYVLNVPMTAAMFGKKYHTAMGARDAAYDRLRSAFISLWNTGDHQLMLNCVDYMIRNGTNMEERKPLVNGLYNRGVDVN